MRKNQVRSLGTAFAVAVIALSGCYSYKEPAAATLSESYSQRQKDSSDEMFKDISLLTLREAQRIAIKNNPTYISAYHSMQAARLKYLQAWGAYSPTITASFDMDYSAKWMLNYDEEEYPDLEGHSTRNHTFTTTTGVRANMLLFDGFSRLFRLKAAKSNFNYQEKLEENACRTMMLSVAYAYNTVLLAIENRRIASEDRDFQKSSLENTRHKFEAGAAPLSDVLNFEIYVNSAEVNLVEADYQYEVAIYALAQLMGYPEGVLPSHIKFPSDYKTEFAELPAVELYLDTALANRPDLKAYREQLNIANYQVYQAWGAYSPEINGYFAWTYSTSNRKGHSTGEVSRFNDNMGLSMGITADWVIFNGAIRLNQLREAKAQRAVAEYSVASQWFAVISEVRTAYANYVQNVKKTKLYAKIRSLSAEQRRLVDEEYRAGKAELTRLNEAQRDLVDAETALASSYINVQNAKAQLTSVVGGQGASYYLGEESAERYPGLDGVKDAVASAESVNGVKQTESVKAPDVKREFSKKNNVPTIPESATAAPAAK
jgi:outer membrane protein TolC